MTVQELIDKLQAFDPKKDVRVCQEECSSGVIHEIYLTDWYSDGKSTPIVIIEANL